MNAIVKREIKKVITKGNDLEFVKRYFSIQHPSADFAKYTEFIAKCYESK